LPYLYLDYLIEYTKRLYCISFFCAASNPPSILKLSSHLLLRMEERRIAFSQETVFNNEIYKTEKAVHER
jgi:hypothetical protein